MLHNTGLERSADFQDDGPQAGAGDAVSLRFLVTALFIFVLVSLAAAQADLEPKATASAEENKSSLRQIPYTINADEVPGAYEILANIGLVDVSTSATVPAIDGIVAYFVQTAQDESVAYDIHIPGVKESVVFNAANSVRATALLFLTLGSSTGQILILSSCTGALTTIQTSRQLCSR